MRLLHRWRVLHLSRRRSRGVWLGRWMLELLWLNRWCGPWKRRRRNLFRHRRRWLWLWYRWRRLYSRCWRRRLRHWCWRRGRVWFCLWSLRSLGFLLCQQRCKLIDVSLEEFELLLARVTCGYNLHHRLQLRIRSCTCCQHMDDWVRSRSGRWLWWRRCLNRLWRRRSRLGFLEDGLSIVVLCVLIWLAVLAVVRP